MAWVTPRTWGSEEATAAKMNEISSSLHAVGDPWMSYTPTWGATSGAAPSVGNGSLTGAYLEAGKTVFYRVVLTLGSSSTMGTEAWTFTLPVEFNSDYALHAPMGHMTMFDTSVGDVYARTAAIFGVSTERVVLRNQDSSAVDYNTPVLWATGDRFFLAGTYERS